MAPIAAPGPLSHLDGVSDDTRARELYKYVLVDSSVASAVSRQNEQMHFTELTIPP